MCVAQMSDWLLIVDKQPSDHQLTDECLSKLYRKVYASLYPSLSPSLSVSPCLTTVFPQHQGPFTLQVSTVTPVVPQGKTTKSCQGKLKHLPLPILLLLFLGRFYSRWQECMVKARLAEKQAEWWGCHYAVAFTLCNQHSLDKFCKNLGYCHFKLNNA